MEKKLLIITDEIVECFESPPEFVVQTARDIRTALEAYCTSDIAAAREIFKTTDSEEVTQYQKRVNDIKNARAAKFKKSATVIKGERVEKDRMPRTSIIHEIYERDMWHCRFCGNPVIHKSVIHYFSKLDIGLRWGPNNVDKHRGVSPFFAVADHLIVHSIGGTNEKDNIVTACGPCNYSRGDLTLAQVGLLNPLDREPKVTIPGWDGLRGLLARAKENNKGKAKNNVS